jgi:hypothetical protein
MSLEEEKAKGDVLRIDSEQAQQSATTNSPEPSPWKAILANPKIVALCLYANLGALMYGFDNLVLSLALTLPPFSYVVLLLMSTSQVELLTSTKKTVRTSQSNNRSRRPTELYHRSIMAITLERDGPGSNGNRRCQRRTYPRSIWTKIFFRDRGSDLHRGSFCCVYLVNTVSVSGW